MEPTDENVSGLFLFKRFHGMIKDIYKQKQYLK